MQILQDATKMLAKSMLMIKTNYGRKEAELMTARAGSQMQANPSAPPPYTFFIDTSFDGPAISRNTMECAHGKRKRGEDVNMRLSSFSISVSSSPIMDPASLTSQYNLFLHAFIIPTHHYFQ